MTDANIRPQHSVLGASASPRYMNCPGSVNMARGVPEGKSSHYAEEGTAAHSLGDQLLASFDDAADHLGATITTDEGSEFIVSQNMADAVQVYIDHCRPLITEADVWGSEVAVDLAPYLSFNNVQAEAWGTTDFYAAVRKTLYVTDYKHGQGVPVSPVENSQLMFYGLGCLLLAKQHEQAVTEVVLTVVQPRTGSPEPESWAISAADLTAWGMGVLVPAMAATLEPTAPLQTGSWCRWCPGRIRCPALKAEALAAAKMEFSPLPPTPHDMTDDELGQVLDRVEVMDLFIKACRGEASARLDDGKKVPGWKLVPKRAVRKWKDPGTAGSVLADLPEAWNTPTLKSVAQIEKVIDKADWPSLEKDLVEKVSSGSTMVPDGDPRQRIESLPKGSEFL